MAANLEKELNELKQQLKELEEKCLPGWQPPCGLRFDWHAPCSLTMDMKLRAVTILKRIDDVMHEIELCDTINFKLKKFGGTPSLELYQEVRKLLLKNADVVVTTLSSSDKLKRTGFKCESLVIDEACQAVEPLTLVPLSAFPSISRCLLVGDPKQLPAMVQSVQARKQDYQRSLFERLEGNGHPVSLLTVQYRMHPDIRHFPSIEFYDGRLKDAESVKARDVPFKRGTWFQPIFFASLHGSHHQCGDGDSKSLRNLPEIEFVVRLLREYYRINPIRDGSPRPPRPVVMTFYKAQEKGIKERLDFEGFGDNMAEVCCVDSFQGREAAVVILSCVRGGGTGAPLGFVGDERRINVALTRAMHSLVIVGKKESLLGSPPWCRLIQDLDKHKRLQVLHSDSDKFLPPQQDSAGAESESAIRDRRCTPARASPPRPPGRPGSAIAQCEAIVPLSGATRGLSKLSVPDQWHYSPSASEASAGSSRLAVVGGVSGKLPSSDSEAPVGDSRHLRVPASESQSEASESAGNSQLAVVATVTVAAAPPSQTLSLQSGAVPANLTRSGPEQIDREPGPARWDSDSAEVVVSEDAEDDSDGDPSGVQVGPGRAAAGNGTGTTLGDQTVAPAALAPARTAAGQDSDDVPPLQACDPDQSDSDDWDVICTGEEHFVDLTVSDHEMTPEPRSRADEDSCFGVSTGSKSQPASNSRSTGKYWRRTALNEPDSEESEGGSPRSIKRSRVD